MNASDVPCTGDRTTRRRRGPSAPSAPSLGRRRGRGLRVHETHPLSAGARRRTHAASRTLNSSYSPNVGLSRSSQVNHIK